MASSKKKPVSVVASTPSGAAALARKALLAARSRGVTAKEVIDRSGVGHGPLSRAFSDLHRLGSATQLQEQRGGRSKVYVLISHVNGRATQPYRGLAQGKTRAVKIVKSEVSIAVGDLRNARGGINPKDVDALLARVKAILV